MRTPKSPRGRRTSLVVVVAGFMAALAACGKREKPNANRDLQRQQENLMAEMDRIAAEEAKKQRAESPVAAEPATPTVPAAKEEEKRAIPDSGGG